MASLAAHLLKSSGTGIIFCSYEQFYLWKQALQNKSLIVEPNCLIFFPARAEGTRKIESSEFFYNITLSAVIFHKQKNFYINKEVSNSNVFLTFYLIINIFLE